ncbi:MAG TPA: TIR domain-containing protein [Thermoanaerobaculia bacterium]|nr:TIR domain-containing protein [Thermoanaerobaculia bacterium]
MARIFISHSSANNAEALALRDWLVARGWDDLFLDIDPQRGLVSGQRWLDRLQESAQRCKAVLFVLSRAWLASGYCKAEFWEARKQDRPLFALVIDDTSVNEVPAEMRGVWQLAFLTRGSRFETFSVQPPPDYAPTQVRFSHEGLESLRLGLVQAGLTSFDTESFPWPARGFEHEADGTTPRRPYRGLKPVDVPDAGVFFGRDADLVRARDHLADLRDRGGRCLVVLLGASGSGKSSFLRAGLLPRLTRDDRRFLPLPVLRPRGAVMWGVEGLLAALEAAHRKADLAVTRAELRQDLEAGGAGFLRRLADLRSAAARGLEKDAKQPTLILPIDQAEELFTTVRGETGVAEAGLFLARLAEILRHGPEALALVTVRSDAYEPLQTTEALAGVPQVPFSLRPLAAADYRSVIEGPTDRATAAGQPLTLEPELTATLLEDAQGADALPLLGFTLERLYVEHGGDGALTRADYAALGGVQGSIEAAVAEAFADPDAAPRIPAGVAEREALLKRAFVPHLMGVNEANGEPVRRTARLADLPGEARGLIDRLVDRRLLVVDRRRDETVIEVAHEALLRRWPTLQRWHDQERVALEIQQEIARASSAWSQNARGADWLAHRGARLAEAEAIARRDDFAAVFVGVPRAYLDVCRQAEDAARDAEARRLARQRAMQRRVGVLLTAVAVVTLAGGWLVVAGRREVARQTSQLIAANAQRAFEAGHYDRAMRLAVVASQGTWLKPPSVDAGIELGRAAHFSRLEAQLTGHKDVVTAASFSPDGARIVTASLDGTARVWSRGENGAWHSFALEGHQNRVNSATFSLDGAHIVTASNDKTARVWSKVKGGAWHGVALAGHQGPVFSAAFSPDGAQIVTKSADGTARVWSKGKAGVWHSVVLEGHQGRIISSASFSPDGAHIVTASDDKTARVWSQGKGGTWTSVVLKGHRGTVNSASFSPDGAHIVTASDDDTARVWSRGEDGTWTSVVLEGRQFGVVSASFSPDGARIVTVAFTAHNAQVWSQGDDGAWASVALEGHQWEVVSASFSPDGARIVTASEDRTARVWSRGDDGAWAGIALVGHRDTVSSASFSLDGAHIVTASADDTARVWSLGEDGAWASVALEGHKDPVKSASFSPDGARIFTVAVGGSARVWNRGKDGSWSSVALEGHQEEVSRWSFSPDGSHIVSPYWGKTALVSSRGKGGARTSVVLEGHQASVNSAAFSPDGTRIVTASDDETARVWSHGEGGGWTSVALEGHQSSVISASFSPDGARIVTASWDKTARVWNIRWLMGPGDWAKTEPLSLPETVCREKLRGSWTTVKDPETGRPTERIAVRLLTADDIEAAPILSGREGEDVCAPFLEPPPWWSRLAFWR